MSTEAHKNFYELDSERFWDPRVGMTGRDLDVYPLLAGLSGRLLEYGCGSGSLLLGLAREARFGECIGVDVSERTLQAVERAWIDLNVAEKDKVKLMVPQADHLPGVPDESIDVVISASSLEHVLDPYVVLDELYRIAKPSGRLICTVPNSAYLRHSVSMLFGIQPRTGTDEPVDNWRQAGWDGMHLHTFTRSSLEILLKDCGWIPEKWTGAGTRFNSLGFGRLRRRFPAFLSGELLTVCRRK